jgi:hypothetical protein
VPTEPSSVPELTAALDASTTQFEELNCETTRTQCGIRFARMKAEERKAAWTPSRSTLQTAVLTSACPSSQVCLTTMDCTLR